MPVLVVSNAKGGVAKTTTTVSLGAALAIAGYSTLVIDTDFQANATTSLGITDYKPCLKEVYLSGGELESIIVQTCVPKLDLVPASLELINLQNLPDLTWLRNRVKQLPSSYQFVILDTSAAFSPLTVSCLIAAEHVIIPVQPHPLAVEGVYSLIEILAATRRNYDSATILGILLTKVARKEKGVQEVVQKLRSKLGHLVFNTEIPESAKQPISTNLHQPIFYTSPRSSSALAYKRFCKELLQKLQIDVLL
ncbi:ATPase involved in chromosome partitioning [Leptolyngbyaceae cyanobacterium JSC-12]|nr:ATPase involved in chromosome partitioning [Leptolyngbyaceae cyanobacterium JSC-12]